jgi:hypothetical protein
LTDGQRLGGALEIPGKIDKDDTKWGCVYLEMIIGSLIYWYFKFAINKRQTAA